MTGPLAHVFLPLTAVCVLWPDRFPSPAYLLLLGGFGLLADFDKVLGQPGLLHSFVTLVPLAGIFVLAERLWRGELLLSPILVALVFSHLLLDLLDGGPVPFLFPFDETGIGLLYPARAVFDPMFPWIGIEGPLVILRTTTPQPGFNTYGFITGVGVASLLLFGVVYARLRLETSRPTD